MSKSLKKNRSGTCNGPSFTLRLKTHKVKLFHKRFNQEILKSTQLANYRNNPLISTRLLFFQNYDHPNY